MLPKPMEIEVNKKRDMLEASILSDTDNNKKKV